MVKLGDSQLFLQIAQGKILMLNDNTASKVPCRKELWLLVGFGRKAAEFLGNAGKVLDRSTFQSYVCLPLGGLVLLEDLLTFHLLHSNGAALSWRRPVSKLSSCGPKTVPRSVMSHPCFLVATSSIIKLSFHKRPFPTCAKAAYVSKNGTNKKYSNDVWLVKGVRWASLKTFT